MNSQKKRELLIHGAQVIGGLLLILPFLDATSWLRFIAIAGILVLLYNLIWFVKHSEEILYEIFPTKHKREVKPNIKDQIWQHVSVVLFGGGLIFLIFQMNKIENIINEPRFWKRYALIGFIIGMVCLILIRLFRPAVFHESGRRYAVVFGFILGSMFAIASSASYLNAAYADSKSMTSKHIVIDKRSGGTRSKSYWIFIEMEHSSQRFVLARSLWDKINKGDPVLLEIKKGFLDFDYVQKIHLIRSTKSYNKGQVFSLTHPMTISSVD